MGSYFCASPKAAVVLRNYDHVAIGTISDPNAPVRGYDEIRDLADRRFRGREQRVKSLYDDLIWVRAASILAAHTERQQKSNRT